MRSALSSFRRSRWAYWLLARALGLGLAALLALVLAHTGYTFWLLNP